MTKSNSKNKMIFSIATLVLTILANIAVILFVVWTYRFSNLEKGAFFSIFGIVLCALIILDIIFFVSYNHKDGALKKVTCVLAVILLIVGGASSLVIGRVNSAVNNIIENDNGEQYETIRVVVSTYDNSSIKSLKDLNGKKVGSLQATGVSAASIGREQIDKEGLNVKYKDYNMSSELYQALVDGEIDAAIFPNTYRSQLLSADEEGYKDFLDKTEDIFKYEEKVKTADSESSKKDLSVEPFTILLIGYAPEPGGGGLTDTIILASVNPQTMEVTMTSIPRDSYVPITCYGGNRSKINDAGAASKACLMETVGELLDVDVDFYMEVNFEGLVEIVDALGGIYINSPVEFVGQSSSSQRGEMNVWVPAGPYTANGEQALAFARERHQMPNGDYDRQIHQQQVISEIAKKLVELRDVNKALAVMEAAGENFSTNLSLKQLTTVFNQIISATNYTGIPQFNLLDIKSTRITGYTYWFYNYSMHLPLWSLYLYDGSIRDNVALHDITLGEFKEIKQEPYFKFFVQYPYDRGPLYYEFYDEPQVPQDMPIFVHKFSSGGYTVDDVRAWADSAGISLNIEYVQEGDPRYVPGAIGLIVDMSAPYGTLASDLGGSFTIWVCGDIPEENKVPNFVGNSISFAKQWAKDNNYTLNLTVIKTTDSNYDASKAGQVISQDIQAGSDKTKQNTISITYMDINSIESALSQLVVGKSTKSDILNWCSTYMDSKDLCQFTTIETSDPSLDGVLASNPVWGNNDGSNGFFSSSWIKFTVYVLGSTETETPEINPTPTPTVKPDPTPTPNPPSPETEIPEKVDPVVSPGPDVSTPEQNVRV